MASKAPLAEQPQAVYWEVASRYWKDIATVNPQWAWDSYYNSLIPDETSRILVMGVTNGSFMELIKQFKPQAWVCGIDLSPGMLEMAISRGNEVICCRGDYLPFEDGSFDFVLSDYFLSVIPEEVLEGTIKEIDRVLKKGGSFVAKELRNRGHLVLWSASSLGCGILGVAGFIFSPLLAGAFFVLSGLALLSYNPFSHTMGKSARIVKFILHLTRFTLRRKKVPTLAEIRDLYFISEKYLHVFTDRELYSVFEPYSLGIKTEPALISWNFSIIGVKQ
ncbi:MAG: class I SAM-dependent methyltransferase [Theionarchaea archaeon]|nr:class I SAM-dependent methyltransferase [Theionarchaea archaeon]